jgi:hypothetical protein
VCLVRTIAEILSVIVPKLWPGWMTGATGYSGFAAWLWG